MMTVRRGNAHLDILASNLSKLSLQTCRVAAPHAQIIRASSDVVCNSDTMFVGFAHGVLAVNDMLDDGDAPRAIVSIDGWRWLDRTAAQCEFVVEALRCKRVLVLAFAAGSADHLGARLFASRATGWNLDAGPIDAPHEQREGNLVVVGYDVSPDELRANEPVVVGYCVALAHRMMCGG